MQAAATTLTRDQVEHNCRAMWLNSFSNLTENDGVLERQGWGNRLVCSLTKEDNRETRILSLCIATLESIQGQMKENPPITFFVQPDWAYHQNIPYNDLATKALGDPLFSRSEKAKQVAHSVRQLYDSVDFGLTDPNRELSTDERKELNDLVRRQMLHCTQGTWNDERKKSFTLSTIRSIQDKVDRNERIR